MGENRVSWCVALVVLTVAGCNGADFSESAVEKGADRAFDTAVVGWVGDVPIKLAEVRHYMQEHAVDAETAAQALVDEELLVQRALELGVDTDKDLQHEQERRLVIALLHDMEADATPESIAADLVDTEIERDRASFEKPERRQAMHVLAHEKTAAGKAFAQSVLDEWRSKKEHPLVVLGRYQTEPPDNGLTITAEKIPPIDRDASFAPEFKDTLFGAKGTGPVSQPVLTEFGWHAIYVQKILPEVHTPRKEAEAQTRERLSNAKRFHNLADLVRTLETSELVVRHEEAIERAASMPLTERSGGS